MLATATTSTKTIRSTRLRLARGLVIGLVNLLLLAGVILVAVPYIFMILDSIKPQYEIFTYPVTILPSKLYLTNYHDLFTQTLYFRWYLNTVIVAVSRTVLSLLLCTLAGYAFAKYEFPLKKPLFIFVIATFTLPFEVVLVPLYQLTQTLGWINSYWVLIVPFAADAFIIFLARQYILAVPTELLEAARMDGAGELTTFFRVVLPLLKPALAVMSILVFNNAWNDFLWPLIVINDENLFVLNLALPSLTGPYGNEYGLVLAGASLATVPVIVLFAILQREFIEGLMAGAIKM
ncbi:MAG: carbohydrate ABC transporter permease [Chloroflexota bacterium]